MERAARQENLVEAQARQILAALLERIGEGERLSRFRTRAHDAGRQRADAEIDAGANGEGERFWLGPPTEWNDVHRTPLMPWRG